VTDKLIEEALQQAVDRGEEGVQFAAYLGDELIVDTWTGPLRRGGDELVDARSMFTVFSTTKAVTATALHVQAERGLVEYDAPVARYWPEFGCNGKERTQVRDVLMHRAGIPQMPEGVTTELACDWDWITSHLATLTPMFEPGTTNAYHSINWGWLVGEIVRRTDPQHRPFGDFVRQEICAPLGIEDLYLGLPASEAHRVGTLVSDVVAVPIDDDVRRAAMPPAVAPTAEIYNRRDVQASCIPGAGGIMSARAGARFFALLANRGELDGVRLLSEDRLLSLTKPRDDPYAPDRAGNNVRWIGVGGYWLGSEGPEGNPLVGRGKHILEHGGAGGSYGWADLDTGLAVTVTHNRMFVSESTPMEEHPFWPLAEAARRVAAGARHA
jgi:CubicO group peptidase (beta-lactamase class C family)